MVEHQFLKAIRGQPQQPAWRFGHHIGRAGRLAEHCDLAEEFTWIHLAKRGVGATNHDSRPDLTGKDEKQRITQVALLQLGLGNLIGVWLVLKVAGHWKRWMDDGDVQTQRPDGRSVFNIFLIGNALTVLYSFVGFKLIGWIEDERILQVCWVSLSVIALTLAFWAWIPGQRKSRFL